MTPSAVPTAERNPRRDAQKNRERILVAAAAAVAEAGWGVSLIEIARRAGVGNATIHRHFTREELFGELLHERDEHLEAALDLALRDPDPWGSLIGYLELLFMDVERNRVLAQIAALRLGDSAALMRKFGLLLNRARDAGALRPDLTLEDVSLVLLGVAETLTLTAGVAPVQWRRHLAVAVSGLRRRDDDEPLPGNAVSAPQLQDAVDRQVAQMLGAGPPSGACAQDVD